MSLLQEIVTITEGVEGLNGISQALQKLNDANDALETAAAASQIVAELAIAGAVTATLRTTMSLVRLGLAISGQIWKWEAISWAAGASSGLTAGAIIDWVNDQHLGSKLYDLTHPDPLLNTSYLAACRYTQPRRDPLTLDLDNDGLETLSINAAAPSSSTMTARGSRPPAAG